MSALEAQTGAVPPALWASLSRCEAQGHEWASPGSAATQAGPKTDSREKPETKQDTRQALTQWQGRGRQMRQNCHHLCPFYE